MSIFLAVFSGLCLIASVSLNIYTQYLLKTVEEICALALEDEDAETSKE